MSPVVWTGWTECRRLEVALGMTPYYCKVEESATMEQTKIQIRGVCGPNSGDTRAKP